jgi:hypothetical protein
MVSVMSLEMKVQILCFLAFVAVSVGSTRLIYHDGVIGARQRLARHCKMLSAMIIILCAWAGSIGFKINQSCVAVIERQQETIQQLTASRGTGVVDMPPMTIVTAAGNKITLGGSYGLYGEGGRIGSKSGRLDDNYTAESGNNRTTPTGRLGGNDGDVAGVLRTVPMPVWKRFSATDGIAAYGVSGHSLEAAKVDF